MTKFMMDDHEFECEKLCPEHFDTGVCAFKIIGDDNFTSYWVVTPPELSDQMTGKYKIETPNDGRVCAFCMNEQDAMMIASSIAIATGVASVNSYLAKEEVDSKTRKLAEKLDFDLDALEAEVRKLKAEGKSSNEISEILKLRMDEFKKKPAADEGGEW